MALPPPPPPPPRGHGLVQERAVVSGSIGSAHSSNSVGRGYGKGVNVGNDDDELEFPFVCENCLGPNPYVRMIQAPNGAACKLTNRPFTVFKWRVRGAAGAGWKVTQICIEVAKMKNCCQVCLKDMTYLVPLAVRDSVLKNNPHQVTLPQTAAGTHYFFEQKKRQEQLRAEQEQRSLQLPPGPPPLPGGAPAMMLSPDVAAMIPPPPPPLPSGDAVEELDDGSDDDDDEEEEEDGKKEGETGATGATASSSNELKRKRGDEVVGEGGADAVTEHAKETDGNKRSKTSKD